MYNLWRHVRNGSGASGGGDYVAKEVAAIVARRAIRALHSSAAKVDAEVSSEKKLFDKILIANRGEIACRVIRSARKMGIKTVAVHSHADANAQHVVQADEAICIGSAASSDSYLRIDRILAAIEKTGAQAVHPGYGFLSENSQFADELEKRGVAFIGPKKHAIEAMGDKIESKLLAKKAGVNVIPGFDGIVKDADHAIEIAADLTYPVMIKASAGGGGKGMRVAHNEAELREGFKLSSEEALSSFGDDRMLIEKFVEKPRHIEIQVLADNYGNTVYLNERECSVQRRNQKVIEEAPSTFLDAQTRKAMGEQAVSLCRAVDYCSAGTVEMLVDKNRNFFFLEMNTRLQVEHPVSELITGVDLVEQMIRIAAGQKLNINQRDIGIKGWAVESRVYAEDPTHYLPSIGRLTSYVEPTGRGVRVDSGIVEGSEISMYYDPMISKLITYGKTRKAALKLMAGALDEYVIKGVKHNIPLLRDIITRPRFIKGDLDTNFLPEEYPDGFHGRPLNMHEMDQLISVAAMMHIMEHTSRFMYSNRNRMATGPLGKHMMPEFNLKIRVGTDSVAKSVNEESMEFDTKVIMGFNDEQVMRVTIDNADPILIHNGNWTACENVIRARVNGEDLILQNIERRNFGYKLRHVGSEFDVTILSHRAAELSSYMPAKVVMDMSKLIVAPMPGVVKSISVNVGDIVAEGQEVAVLEAMKMQNSLRAERTGRVKAVLANAGSTLDVEDIIIEFEDEDEESI